MRMNDISMEVVITTPTANHTAREYISPRNRQTYVEGREGSNFILRLRNNTAARVLAVPSVDGLSVMDGKAAGAHSGGYIIEGRSTLDIPGWMLDGDTAAQFFFAGKTNGQDASYAAQSGADTANKGVIGLRVYSEKVKYQPPIYRSFGAMPKGIAPTWPSPTAGLTWSDESSRGIYASASNTLLGSNAMADNAVSASLNSVVTPDPIEQTLGTGFGQATDFQTTKTEFERADLIAQLVIYYDDSRGLKRVGIDVSQPVAKRPSAFPADAVGCVPPANWKR